MIATREVTYVVDDLTMVAHLAQPDGEGPWPTVLIGHDGVGLDDYQRGRADHLAGRGYLALAMDYHGGRTYFGDPQGMLARVMPMLADPDRMQRIGRAALEALLAVPGADPARLAALGYGAGANVVLELARAGMPFRAVGVVHPGLPQAGTAGWAGVTGTFLVATGSEDPISTPDQVLTFGRELQEAGVDWRVHVHGGAEHAFWAVPSNPDGTPTGETVPTVATVPGVSHHPATTRRSWHAVLDLLDEAFGPPVVPG